MIGLSWGILLQGTVVVELVFRWPGMGRWATDAILRGDRATIMAFVLVTSIVFLTREPDRRRDLRPSRSTGRPRDVSSMSSISHPRSSAPSDGRTAGPRPAPAVRRIGELLAEAMKSPTTVVGAVIIVLLMAMALFAPLLIDANHPDPYQMPQGLAADQRPAGHAWAPPGHDARKAATCSTGSSGEPERRLRLAFIVVGRHGGRRRRDRQSRRLPRRAGRRRPDADRRRLPGGPRADPRAGDRGDPGPVVPQHHPRHRDPRAGRSTPGSSGARSCTSSRTSTSTPRG